MYPSTIQYPRLEIIMKNLLKENINLRDTAFSSKFTLNQVEVVKNMIIDTHGKDIRKHSKGELYIEEHLAEVMEWGNGFNVPHSVIAAFGLHDFREDHISKFAYKVNKEDQREGNNGKLEQQIDALDFESVDKDIILNVTYLMTKPTNEEMGRFLEGIEDRRFIGKIFGCLGEEYWVRKFPSGIKNINTTQRFYAGVGIILDMWSNGNSKEEPRKDVNIEKFFYNQQRNTLRLLHMGKLVDHFIRTHSLGNHLIFDTNNYDKFRQEYFIPRIVDGVNKFGLKLDNHTKKYWKLQNF